MSERDGGPAFPATTSQAMLHETGMSLRDYFAAAALNLMAAADVEGLPANERGPLISRAAYAIADWMLHERARGDKAGKAHGVETRG